MNYALLQDDELVRLITGKGDASAFREIYERYWEKLFLAAYQKVRSKEVAEELVQNLFLSLWERRETVEIQHVKSWLFNAVRYSIINHYKSQMIHEKYIKYVEGNLHEKALTAEQVTNFSDLTEAIEKGIALLPEKTQHVFKMSRYENRSVKEIAETLGISEKAVEYHITQSLKRMRIHLKDHLLLLLVMATWLLNN